jgi:hypothetical protein
MGAKSILRAEAKKLYKENTKKIPKRNRIPFAQFFKKFVEMKRSVQKPAEVEAQDDFNFDDMVKLNSDLQVEESMPDEKLNNE